MATSQNTIDFLLDQLNALNSVSAKKMFGEYCLYLDSKPVGVVCDDLLFLKPTGAGRALLTEPNLAPPYPNAKPHLQIDPDAWEDADWLCELVSVTALELPMPKPRKPRKPKKASVKKANA